MPAGKGKGGPPPPSEEQKAGEKLASSLKKILNPEARRAEIAVQDVVQRSAENALGWWLTAQVLDIH